MCALLRTRPLIALDTESDSLYSYYPKVCLIQISTFADPDDTDPRQVLDYLVDPLRLTRLDELGELLADQAQVLVTGKVGGKRRHGVQRQNRIPLRRRQDAAFDRAFEGLGGNQDRIPLVLPAGGRRGQQGYRAGPASSVSTTTL